MTQSAEMSPPPRNFPAVHYHFQQKPVVFVINECMIVIVIVNVIMNLFGKICYLVGASQILNRATHSPLAMAKETKS